MVHRFYGRPKFLSPVNLKKKKKTKLIMSKHYETGFSYWIYTVFNVLLFCLTPGLLMDDCQMGRV